MKREVEEAQLEAVARCGAGHEQVGGRADQRRHAAEDADERKRQQHTGVGEITLRSDGDDDGYEHHHHRGVVQHRAGDERRAQQHDDGARNAAPAHLRQPFCGLVEGVGGKQRLSHHKQRQHGYQRRVGKPRQECSRRNVHAFRLRHGSEQQQEDDQCGERYPFDGIPLGRIGDDGAGNDDIGRPEVELVQRRPSASGIGSLVAAGSAQPSRVRCRCQAGYRAAAASCRKTTR